MPDDRFIHPRLGHGEKVFQLNDLEFRVWMQYLLSSDDCGVMRFSPLTVQDDNERLAKLSTKKIMAALTKLVTIGLLTTFQHQSRTYLCQLDWQEWQKVRWPRASVNPQPDEETLAKCTPATQGLFAAQAKHRHGAASESAPSTHGDPAEMSPSLTGGEHRLPATAAAEGNGSGGRARTGSGAMAGELPRDHLRHSVCGRMCLHEKQFAEFVQKIGGGKEAATERVRAWGESVLREWGDDGLKANATIQGTSWQFWNVRYEEWQGSPKAAGLSAEETRRIAKNRAIGGGTNCPHEPMCRTIGDCTTRILADARAEREAGKAANA